MIICFGIPLLSVSPICIDHIWAIFSHPRSHPRFHPRCSVRAIFVSASVTPRLPFMYPPILADPISLSLGEGRGEVFYFIA